MCSQKSPMSCARQRRSWSLCFAPAGHLHRWLQLSSVLCFSSYFALSLSPSFALLSCCWLCSSFLLLALLFFPAVWLRSSFLLFGFALLACCLALLFCLQLAMLFSVLFIISPDLRVLLAVLVPLLRDFVLLATGSLGVVPGFSPLALWLWLCL